MDPSNGRLYQSLEDALLAGVKNPVQLIGRPADVQRISKAVKADSKKKAKRKAQQKSRRANRG